ncbi:SDR family NAD(P)-dependent oxidoreductase [Sphingomicrobium sediminis]|uniref:SDR family NAD(P)-dependent oxidoreductase n=1 Tax=Sphingomicrobium sediminis TaxID=2950949 RepID=A0A9X2J3R0_9SPHN|nr:SDR family NAD(P)-dependent oxidoreductase [Sphingomicrobium sediminis]MCM8556452.1 SDR family NAD(P)-dependent oxidoreductase [Sphingomicrobium sediminis]
MEKCALVTGSRHRVGAAIARHLADAGWRVFAHVRRGEDDVPEGCERVVADLEAPDCAARLFDQIGDVQVGLLVNNASLFEPDDLGTPDVDAFDRQMRVNARAPMLLTSAFAARHVGGGDALIVNISDAKLAAPNPDYLSYTLSKGALSTLTETSARALAHEGIRVNAVAPAVMLPSGPMSNEDFAEVHDFNPLRRGVGVDDLLAALDSLIANPVLTGQTLLLDAGQRFMALDRDVAFLKDEE